MLERQWGATLGQCSNILSHSSTADSALYLTERLVDGAGNDVTPSSSENPKGLLQSGSALLAIPIDCNAPTHTGATATFPLISFVRTLLLRHKTSQTELSFQRQVAFNFISQIIKILICRFTKGAFQTMQDRNQLMARNTK